MMDPTEQLEQVQNELLCSICYDYFIQAITLSCSHSFCFNCISVWRTNNQNCPICRSHIYTMAPSRALDNMVAALHGNQNRLQFTEGMINNLQNSEDGELDLPIHDVQSQYERSVDTDHEYNLSDTSSIENEDPYSFDIDSQDDYYDSGPEDDYEENYDNATDENISLDDSYLVDDIEDVLSISHGSDDDYNDYDVETDGEEDSHSNYSYQPMAQVALKHPG